MIIVTDNGMKFCIFNSDSNIDLAFRIEQSLMSRRDMNANMSCTNPEKHMRFFNFLFLSFFKIIIKYLFFQDN